MTSRRVLMIALDSAEPSLIERWTADGSLPVLRDLLQGGHYCRLRSSAEWLVGSPWSTFYRSQDPADHGFYQNIVWRPQQMDHAAAGSGLELTPFWHDLAAHGARVISFDIPFAPPPVPFNGIEVNGWANTDRLHPRSAYPSSMIRKLDSRFGKPPTLIENYRPESVHTLFSIRDEEIRATAMIGEAVPALFREQAWDFAIACLQTTHGAAHKLWNDRSVEGEVPATLRDTYDDALRQLYIAADSAVGELVAAAGPDTDIFVFSLHGMGTNTSRSDLMGDLIRMVLGQNRRSSDQLANTVRSLVPPDFRYQVKKRLPQWLQIQLSAYWRTGAPDWSQTRAISVFSDVLGYVRVNQQGREAKGIVAPGADYDALLDEIIDGLGSFVDADTGEPLVTDSITAAELYPEGTHRHTLPDLIVRFNDTEAATHNALHSPRFGDLPWPTPGRHFTGRSGTHRSDGFMIANGPRLEDKALETAHILDLAPTVHDLLSAPHPYHFSGRSLLQTSGPEDSRPPERTAPTLA